MTKNENLSQYFRNSVGDNVAFPDIEHRFLKQETGVDGTTPDLWGKYLRGLGNEGTINDMIAKWSPEDTPPINLLEGLSWTAGANTTLNVADGFARAARSGANPRIYKHAVDKFIIGATYQLGAPNSIYKRNSTNVVFRISDTASIGTDGPYDTGLLTADTVINTTFIADATSYYFGLVGVNNLNGQYVECDEDFSVTYVSGP